MQIISPTRTMLVQLIPDSKSNMYFRKAHVKRSWHLAGRVPVASVPYICQICCLLQICCFLQSIHPCMHAYRYIYIYTVYVCIHIDTYTCHNLGSSHHVLHPQIYRSKNSFHTWNCKGSTHHELRQPRKSAVARCPTWCSWASSCNGWPVFFAQNGKKLVKFNNETSKSWGMNVGFFKLSLKLRSFRKFCNFSTKFFFPMVRKNSLQGFFWALDNDLGDHDWSFSSFSLRFREILASRMTFL